jgi:opacity protein-like surface antigen
MEIHMKRSTVAVLFLALATTSTAAFADNDSGMYVGVGAGQYNVETDNISSATFKGDATVYKLFAGYRFNPYISMELDYIDLGSPSDTISNIKIENKVNGFAPYIIGTIPLGPIEVFGRVGYYFYNVDFKGSVGAITSSLSDSKQDVVYGAGAGITIFEHLHARLEYEMFDLENTKTSNAVWLSGAWRF